MGVQWGMYLREAATYFSTFTVQRNVALVDAQLGVVLWILRALILSYFIWNVTSNFLFLHIATPELLVNGWFEPGTYYTGAGQTYQADGSVRPLDISDPYYCRAPYTDSYYESAVFGYTNVRCVHLPERELWKKGTPRTNWVTTFYFDYRTTSMPCNDPVYSLQCNRSSAGVIVTGDTCLCKTDTAHYTINPEGLYSQLGYTFTVNPFSNEIYTGGNLGSGDVHTGADTNLGVTTIVQHVNGSVLYTFQPGQMVQLSIGQWVELSGESLDERVSISKLSKAEAEYMPPGMHGEKSPPFNRMTGMALEVDMKIVNFDSAAGDQYNRPSFDKNVALWSTQNVACLITATRRGMWTSFGPEIIHYERPVTYSPDNNSSRVDEYNAVFTERYRFGVKMIYQAHGEVGFFDFTLVIETLVQLTVLMNLATFITNLVAIYLCRGNGTSQIFEEFQTTHLQPSRALARCALLSALQCRSWFTTLDHDFTGEVSLSTFFKHLRLIVGENQLPDGTTSGLSDAQIARVISDCITTADLLEPEVEYAVHQSVDQGAMSLDEFIVLTGDQFTPVGKLVNHYKNESGDTEMLQKIQDLMKYEDDGDDQMCKMTSLYQKQQAERNHAAHSNTNEFMVEKNQIGEERQFQGSTLTEAVLQAHQEAMSPRTKGKKGKKKKKQPGHIHDGHHRDGQYQHHNGRATAAPEVELDDGSDLHRGNPVAVFQI